MVYYYANYRANLKHMKKNISEKRKRFWNEELNSYEKETLFRAGFRIPEHFLDIPFVGLVILENFGFTYALDVLQALCCYFELPENEYTECDEIIIEIPVEYFADKNNCDIADMDSETSLLVEVDNIFLYLGYDSDEKISQLTIKELLNIKGVEECIITFMGQAIFEAYNKTYIIPKHKFILREDLKYNSYLLFENLK